MSIHRSLIHLTRLCVLIFLLGSLSTSTRADELYAALGLGGKAGEPNFDENRPPITLAYELQRTWRFSWTSGDYDHITQPVSLETQILGVERVWYKDMGSNMALIGAFGPGLFQATLKSGAGSDSGSKFGILATGNLRIYLSKGFLDLGYHYRNAAVIINRSSFNGGYEAFALGFGLRL